MPTNFVCIPKRPNDLRKELINLGILEYKRHHSGEQCIQEIWILDLYEALIEICFLSFRPPKNKRKTHLVSPPIIVRVYRARGITVFCHTNLKLNPLHFSIFPEIHFLIELGEICFALAQLFMLGNISPVSITNTGLGGMFPPGASVPKI